MCNELPEKKNITIREIEETIVEDVKKIIVEDVKEIINKLPEKKHVTKEMELALKRSFPLVAYKSVPGAAKLTSLKPQYIIERLNEVFGVGRWYLDTKMIHNTDTEYVVKGKLVFLDYEIFLHETYGSKDKYFWDKWKKENKYCSLADLFKSADTDCLSKSASYLGIGMDVFKGLITVSENGTVTHLQEAGNQTDIPDKNIEKPFVKVPVKKTEKPKQAQQVQQTKEPVKKPEPKKDIKLDFTKLEEPQKKLMEGIEKSLRDKVNTSEFLEAWRKGSEHYKESPVKLQIFEYTFQIVLLDFISSELSKSKDLKELNKTYDLFEVDFEHCLNKDAMGDMYEKIAARLI